MLIQVIREIYVERTAIAKHPPYYAIGYSRQIDVPVPADVQHDPEPVARRSLASGRNDKAEFFRKQLTTVIAY
jgi:hypothetical protein